jgi:hypothetical protein
MRSGKNDLILKIMAHKKNDKSKYTLNYVNHCEYEELKSIVKELNNK